MPDLDLERIAGTARSSAHCPRAHGVGGRARRPSGRAGRPPRHRPERRRARTGRTAHRRSGPSTSRPPRASFRTVGARRRRRGGLLERTTRRPPSSRWTARCRWRCSRSGSRRASRMPTPPCTSASSPTRCTSTPTSRRSPTTSGPAPSGTGTSGGRRSTTRSGPSGPGPRSPAASVPAGPATCSTRCDRPTSTARPTSRRRSPTPPRGPARGRGRSRPPPCPSAGWRSASRTPWRCSGSGRTGCPIAWPPARRRTSWRRPLRPTPIAASRYVQDAFRWAVDPEAARAAGMLLTVRDSDMAFGRPLANGLTRLVVLGVDWTLTPEQGADVVGGAARRARRVR